MSTTFTTLIKLSLTLHCSGALNPCLSYVLGEEYFQFQKRSKSKSDPNAEKRPAEHLPQIRGINIQQVHSDVTA